MSEETIRINKFLSQSGYCSRREADGLITQERVLINGKMATMGQQVGPKDQILVDGEVLQNKSNKRKIYLAFHKPKGIVCTTDTRVEKDNIIDFINYPERIFPIGRLDKMSEGLILMTNDGDIVNKILRARNQHEKEYVVSVNKLVTADFVKNMAAGVPVLDTVTRPCVVEQIHKKKFKIILTQGLNRQIRRMCEYLNYRVVHLKRIRIMNINLDLTVGKYRTLRPEELTLLNQKLKHSHKKPG